jgi:hypothetical protein
MIIKEIINKIPQSYKSLADDSSHFINTELDD